jgi:hypothetical protein
LLEFDFSDEKGDKLRMVIGPRYEGDTTWWEILCSATARAFLFSGGALVAVVDAVPRVGALASVRLGFEYPIDKDDSTGKGQMAKATLILDGRVQSIGAIEHPAGCFPFRCVGHDELCMPQGKAYVAIHRDVRWCPLYKQRRLKPFFDLRGL